ncbi:olfactory receptor 1361-like [Ornithorhynchus anatinus]|uniref:Olfactory receptor n=1 Tax=Ornithorhynchus anatinus TaxID=9258 RepID=A0A6I8PF74_ORNAN|nr:olfactory receptor 1361-like [Ornithorhynchus anatinus]
MEKRNQTQVSEFILVGFSGQPDQQRLLFGLFLAVYSVSVLGNLLIILAVRSDPRLHTPMYFFLVHLSFVDICLTSTTVPRMLENLWAGGKSIPFAGCLAQMYFFLSFVNTDGFLLAAMAYDRFLAICRPLRYAAAMGPRLCTLLVAGPWLVTHSNALVQTLMMARLSFCVGTVIPHFFCEFAPLLQLACSDTHFNERLALAAAVLLGFTPAGCILASYARIVSVVLRVPSARGKRRAFSTCGSHLVVVTLFYGTGIGVYLCPAAAYPSGNGPMASLVYAVVTPTLNPFLYSLRNGDMKGALRKVICGRFSHH